MKSTIILGICILLIINCISFVESDSSCSSDCDEDCSSSVCSTGCKTNCPTPCKRKCNKNADCRNKCEVKVPEETKVPDVQKTKEASIVLQKAAETKTSSVNDIRNDYNVDINPNISLTNSISNINNISVPINITSVNMNEIRVSSSDSRSTQTNITAGGSGECSRRNPPPSCGRGQRQIIVVPYPRNPPPQIVTPPPQPRVIVQPIVREPFIVQAPQTPPPQPQRIPIIIPTPVIQQNPVPVQPQPTVVQPIPQYFWFSQQYIRQPQQTVVTQPQQQMIYTAPSQPCGTPGAQCGSYCMNQPCSLQSQPIIPINYPFPSSPCQGGGCNSRMMYAITSPYISSNQMSQYSGINPFYSGNGLAQYGISASFDSRNGPSQMGGLKTYNLRNALPQYNNLNGNFMERMPVGVDSYFIPDQFSRYQIQGGNSSEIPKIQ